MTESNAQPARPGVPADHGRPAPAPRAAGSPLSAELDAMQQANRDVLAIAREFEDLHDRLDWSGMVDATVDGVRVPFPAAAVLAAKRAELTDRWQAMEASAARVREAIRGLLEQTEPPASVPTSAAPRAPLLNVVTQAMSAAAAGGEISGAGGAGPAPLPDTQKSAADIASRFAPASARIRIPGDPFQDR